MARFTDRDKWKDTWFRKLQPAEKLLWLYIVDTCDNAGFFELDVEMCSFVMKLDEDRILGAIKGLSKGLIRCKETDHYYVRNFLKHQLNLPLAPANNAHKQIIRIIVSRKDDFPSIYKKHLPSIKGLISLPSKGNVKVKEEVLYSEEFLKFWSAYPKKDAKATAYKAWVKIKQPPELSVILNAITIQSKTEKWTKSNGEFVPMPSTWINGRCWENESNSSPQTQSEAPTLESIRMVG